MSAEQKVQMEFVISESSLSKLSAIMGGGDGQEKKDTNLGKMSKIMEGFSLKSVAKMATIVGIATTGVGLVKQIFKMTMQASPMLQSMLKLFQVGFMFILRPIGDFVGFLLRPLMIYLLRSVFLPWYRQMAPLMRTWGAGLGENLLNFVKDPFGSLQEWVEGTFWGKITAALVPVIGMSYIASKIYDVVKDLDIDLGAIAGGIGEKVTTFFNGIGLTLQTWWNTVGNTLNVLSNFFSVGIGGIQNTIGKAWSAFTGFFTGALGNIGNLLGGAWGNFAEWISGTLGAVGNTLQGYWTNFTNFFASLGTVWTVLGTAWNNFLSFITELGNILNSLNPGNFFADLGSNLQQGAQQLMGGNSNTNNVNVSVSGGSPEFDVEGLKNMLFGWMEDNNSMRY